MVPSFTPTRPCFESHRSVSHQKHGVLGWVLPQHAVPPPTPLALPEAEGQRSSKLLHQQGAAKKQSVVQSLDQCFTNCLGPCPPACWELWLPAVPRGCACLFLGLLATQVGGAGVGSSARERLLSGPVCSATSFRLPSVSFPNILSSI